MKSSAAPTPPNMYAFWVRFASLTSAELME